MLNGGFFPTAEAEAFVAAIDDVRERASSRGGFDESRVGLFGALGGGSSRRTSNPVPDAEEDGGGDKKEHKSKKAKKAKKEKRDKKDKK